MEYHKSFKQFLQLSESEVQTLQSNLLLEVEKKKKKIPKPKPRPKKILWFQDRNLWHNDLQFAHGGKFDCHSSQEQEENVRNVYATDPDKRVCYGVWQGARQRGVTFHSPRPLHAVKHPRSLLKLVTSGNIPVSNIR